MSFDRSQVRLERFYVESAYHAAYTFWNLRGLLAERWAHGPIFGAAGENPGQVNLSPPQEAPDDDVRLNAVYGLRGSALNAEGPKWVKEGEEIADQWMTDVFQALKPQRVIRNVVRLFSIYPVSDPAAVSIRMREVYGNEPNLTSLLPPTLASEVGRYHSAIDLFVPLSDDGTAVSVVVGTVGPPHQSGFFAHPDPDRDSRWWLGIQYERRHVTPRGIPEPADDLKRITKLGFQEHTHVFEEVLANVL